MQHVRNGTLRRNIQVGGWLTDTLKTAASTAKNLLPGSNPSRVVVNVPAAETPAWVVPAMVVGVGVIAFALLKRK